MSSRYRLFIVVALIALVAGLGVGFFTHSTSPSDTSSLRPPSGLEYVSHDSSLVGFVDIRRVMKSDLRHRLAALLSQPATGRARFKSETGIDLETDVDSLLAIVTPATNGDRPLVLARGRFHPAFFEGLVREGAATVDEHVGEPVFVHADVAVSFVQHDVALIGTPRAVHEAIDTAASHTGITGNTEVMSLMTGLHHDGAWLVARLDVLADGFALPANFATRIPPIQWLSASGDITDGIDGVMRARMRDEAAAEDLRSMLAGFVALGRLRGGRSSEIARSIDLLGLEADGRTVSLVFRVSAHLIEELATKYGRLQ